jgi:hypothetical protein
MINYLITFAELAAVIAGTVLNLEWAANIAFVLIWVFILASPPLYFLTLIVLLIDGSMDADSIEKIKKACRPSAKTVVFRLIRAGEIALLAAYGWIPTAFAAGLGMFLAYFLRGLVLEAANKAVPKQKEQTA